MQYSVLGKTGIKVSRLSFGASSLGSVFHPVPETDGIAAVHAALDCGINYFDVAPAYGGTRAEVVLGKALRGISRGRFFLSTKVGKYTSPSHYGDDTLDYSRARIRRSIEESARRLNTDYFDLLHIHDIEYQGRRHTEQALTEGYEAVVELKKEGRAGGVSFGIYPLDLWRRILQSVAIDAALIHNHYCLNDTTLLDLLPLAAARNVGVINASPFACGLLTEQGAPNWHPASEEVRATFRAAAEFCARQGTSLSKLALQFAVQNQCVATTLFSSGRASAVIRNVQWCEERPDAALLGAVAEILAPVRDLQWDYDRRPAGAVPTVEACRPEISDRGGSR